MHIRIKTERLGETEVIYFEIPTAQDSRRVYLMPHEAIELLRDQFSMKEIADQLGVSPFTVQGYRMRKPVTRRPFANLCQLVNKAEAIGQFPREALDTEPEVYSDRDTQKNGF